MTLGLEDSTLNPKISEVTLTCCGDAYFLSFWHRNNQPRERLTMIGVGNFKANDCNGLSRRSFLKTAAAVPFAMGAGLPNLLKVQAAQERGRAKSVILRLSGRLPFTLTAESCSPRVIMGIFFYGDPRMGRRLLIAPDSRGLSCVSLRQTMDSLQRPLVE